MRIAGSKVLLTGATGGIGAALARELTAKGADLVVSSRRIEPLAALAAETGAHGIPADLSDSEQVTMLARQAGMVDILIANAALPASGDLPDYSLDQVHRALAVNLTAPVQLAWLLVPGMVQAGCGHLAFVGSLSGKAATKSSCLYTATKFGLRGFALALRQDLRFAGVGVSHVAPGFVRDAGMFAATGAPTPSGVGTVSPRQVATAVIDAIERDRCEVSVAPARLRWLCAVASQFPRLAAPRRPNAEADLAIRQIVEAQRALR